MCNPAAAAAASKTGSGLRLLCCLAPPATYLIAIMSSHRHHIGLISLMTYWHRVDKSMHLVVLVAPCTFTLHTCTNCTSCTRIRLRSAPCTRTRHGNSKATTDGGGLPNQLAFLFKGSQSIPALRLTSHLELHPLFAPWCENAIQSNFLFLNCSDFSLPPS